MAFSPPHQETTKGLISILKVVSDEFKGVLKDFPAVNVGSITVLVVVCCDLPL